MRRTLLTASFLACLPTVALADTLQVGPDKPYTTVNAAIAAAQPGDVIEVDAGEYVDDVTTITTGDLTIRGVGDTPAHLRATVPVANQKGILAIEVGTGPVVIENLEFSGAFIEGNGDNAAGIRMQGESLVVRDCFFHDNQNGILAGGTPDYDITIENSEFGHNGNPGSGQEHNVYISGDTRLFIFMGNYSHHAYSGHTLKSRARESHILYNRFSDEADGSSSYLIDLPNGNLAYVIGNVVEQGPMAENTGTLLNFNAEDAAGPDNRLFVVNNTFVNDNGSSPAFVRAHNTDQAEVVLRNNLWVGSGTPFAEQGGTAALTDEGNLAPKDPGFVDREGYDYNLLESSVARDVAVDPGADGDVALLPTEQYVHPAATATRPSDDALDVGAHEWGELEPPTGTSGGQTSGSDDSGGGSEPTSGGADGGADSSTGATSNGSAGAGEGSTETDAAPEAGGDTDGCGCTSDPHGGWAALMLGLVALRLRRRRSATLSRATARSGRSTGASASGGRRG